RLAHVVEQVLLHAGLVHDDVRELRQAVLGVLNASGAHDPRAIVRRRAPEDGLVHPVRFADEPRAHPESLEHFHGAARDAIGLAELERTVAALDQSGADPGKHGELRREQRPGGATADDEDVDGSGKVRRSLRGTGWLREDVGIAGRVPVEVELHAFSWALAKRVRSSVVTTPLATVASLTNLRA